MTTTEHPLGQLGRELGQRGVGDDELEGEGTGEGGQQEGLAVGQPFEGEKRDREQREGGGGYSNVR